MKLPPPRPGMVREAIVTVTAYAVTFAVFGAFVGLLVGLSTP